MELQRTAKPGINIATETEVLGYTYSQAPPVEVILRVDLGIAITGQPAGPITGGGSYILNAYVNNVLVTPVATDPVPHGLTSTIVVSRGLPLSQNDVVSIRVIGQAGDTAVNVVTTMRTTTPVQRNDIIGTGQVPVDHNYGGTNNLAYMTVDGRGVAGAFVAAYLKSDYDTSNRSNAFIVGQTSTDANGGWLSPLMLNPGATYTLIYYGAAKYGPDRRDFTV